MGREWSNFFLKGRVGVLKFKAYLDRSVRHFSDRELRMDRLNISGLYYTD